MVRAGLRFILDTEPGIDVLGEAADGLEALAFCERHDADVVLMDIRMPGIDGIEATRRLRALAKPPRIIVLTTFDLDEYIYEALRAGASGFILKDVSPEALVAGIRTVAAGDAVLGPDVTRRVVEEFARTPPLREVSPQVESLTLRESEILALLARGRSNAEIARELVISEATVKSHVSHILLKLDLADRVQAVIFAYETGLVRPGDKHA
jgi:DNA-binding NarL/FixJ family response regulator